MRPKSVTAAMLGAEVLAVRRYPTASFRVATVKPLEKQAFGTPGVYELEGRMTLHGVERPLKLDAAKQVEGVLNELWLSHSAEGLWHYPALHAGWTRTRRR